jgi:hypothetical protein
MNKGIVFGVIGCACVASVALADAINVSVMCMRSEYRVQTIYSAAGRTLTNKQEGASSQCSALQVDSLQDVVIEKLSTNGWIRVLVTKNGVQTFDSGKVRTNALVRMTAVQK